MRWITVIVLCVPWLAPPALAEDRAVARQAFHEGSLQYDLGEFKSALEAFKRAYLNFEDPVILFNIAQCQRHLDQKAEALRSFRVFLQKMPNSHDRPQVEKLIDELQSAIDHDKAASTRPPIGMLPPSRTSAPEPAREPEPAAAPATSPAPAPVPIGGATSAEKPKKKAWVWGVVAGGVVLVAGAVALGVVFGAPHHDYLELSY